MFSAHDPFLEQPSSSTLNAKGSMLIVWRTLHYILVHTFIITSCLVHTTRNIHQVRSVHTFIN